MDLNISENRKYTFTCSVALYGGKTKNRKYYSLLNIFVRNNVIIIHSHFTGTEHNIVLTLLKLSSRFYFQPHNTTLSG